ncbi:hypothetical protein GON09_005000 [Rhodococcus sp. B50]|nr:hypothetical protein [Rhodococcus sp. B50]
MPKHATILAVTKHLHPVRLSTYTSRCGNDPYLALELYKWNLQLSAAFQQVLAVTEVALRNAIDEQLRIWNAAQPRRSEPGSSHVQRGGSYGQDWLIDAARPLNSLTRDSRRSAGSMPRRPTEPEMPRTRGKVHQSRTTTSSRRSLSACGRNCFPRRTPPTPASAAGRSCGSRRCVTHSPTTRMIPTDISSPTGPVVCMGSVTASHTWSLCSV